MRSFWLLALGLTSLSASASVEQGLAQCAAVQDKLDRLICYDKLAESVASNPAAATVTQPQAGAPAAVVAATPAATAVSAAPVAPVAPVSQPAPAMEDSFGKVKKTEAEPERIELVISALETDAYNNLKISFTNGQVWKQTDGRKFKLKTGENVYIEKGALGAFYLGLESRNTTIRVKRLK
ncbi:hypothetical protein [Shewanella litorisediminis]|uniref:Periplasmic protein n=1 Tax=Shewanella litorisediminis TaxID=1173586 RepID=A0ABX7G249_9GAMM|nr:hypothetical protein [Shewanella litorisediminis]MCL2918587.1 hypothetical protein [Shewanella litorisediminis]QRH01412.1 hypothetical protein JQC75_16420 [Shewanella litorisediminis]